MSDDSSPLRSLFETQQELIENGQQFVESTMRVPLEMNAAFQETLEEQKDLQQDTLELTHDAVTDVLETIESAGPGGELVDVRDAVDEGFETLLDQHEQVFESVDEGYEDALQELDRALEELLEQVQILIELNEQLEQQADAVDGVYEQLGTTLEDQFAGFDDVVSPTESASEGEQIEHQREQIESVREHIEDLRTELEDTVEEGTGEGDGEADAGDSGAGNSDAGDE